MQSRPQRAPITMTANDAIALWNKAFPLTYPVDYWPGWRDETILPLRGHTLGPAREMGGAAVVPIRTASGGTDHIALTHIAVIAGH